MAEVGTLRPGDVVTHKDWEPDTIRMVIDIREPIWTRDRICILNAPAFPKDHITVSLTENQLYNRWMESGLIKKETE